MPTLQQGLPILLDEGLDRADLSASKPPTPFQPHWIEPELGLGVVAFHMDVGRFAAVRGIEEEPIKAPNKTGSGTLAALPIQGA
jgi:hypothetical protein